MRAQNYHPPSVNSKKKFHHSEGVYLPPNVHTHFPSTMNHVAGAAHPRSNAYPRPHIAALLAGLLSLILYLLTMNLTFGFVDKGEMAAAAATLGLPHPTGYPTIILLGKLFTTILPVREILALNILAALLTAAGVAGLSLLFSYLLQHLNNVEEYTTQGREPTNIYAALAALFTGFTATWWGQGNGFEAYSLFAALLPVVTLLFLRYVDQQADGAPHVGFGRSGAWFAGLLGLAFTAHLMMVLLAPAFLFWYFYWLGFNRRAFLRLLFLAPFFLLGLLPYFYLMIASSGTPAVSMGTVNTLGRLADYITGAQFQGYMLSGPKVFAAQSSFFFGKLPSELGYIGLIVLLLGVITLFRRSWPLAVVALLTIAAGVMYAGQFAIKEIEPFYLTAIFGMGMCVAAGMLWMRRTLGRTATLAVAGAMVVATCAMNFGWSNERGNTLAEDYSQNVLETLPRNAFLLSTRWDYLVSPSYYLQEVQGVRPDVVVLNPNLLRSAAYLEYFQQRRPDLARPALQEIQEYLRLGERAGRVDKLSYQEAMQAQRAFYRMVNAIVDGAIRRRPVCVTLEVDSLIAPRRQRVPYYLAFVLRSDTAYLPQRAIRYNFRPWRGRVDADVMNIHEMYTVSALYRANYEAVHGRRNLAEDYINYALTFDPNIHERDVPPLPLTNREGVLRVIRSYRELRSKVANGGGR